MFLYFENNFAPNEISKLYVARLTKLTLSLTLHLTDITTSMVVVISAVLTGAVQIFTSDKTVSLGLLNMVLVLVQRMSNTRICGYVMIQNKQNNHWMLKFVNVWMELYSTLCLTISILTG